MKKLGILVMATLLAITTLHAQQKTIEKTLNVPANKKVDLNLKFANDIKVTAWDKKEVSIKITYEINSGKLNDALLTTFESDSESARVRINLDQEILQKGRPEDCPQNHKGYSRYINNGNEYVSCSIINYEVMVPRDADLKLESISGDIVLRGLNGPVEAKSISGYVDMDWPTKKGAAVAMKTISGELFSDLDISFSNKKENPIVGYELKGDLNGGGSTLKLHSISGNIYFRKLK